MATITILRAGDYRRMRWKNGAGWTTELMVQPGDGDFAWRISIAEIDADGEFSLFEGVDRSILVLAGGGMELVLAGESAVLRVDGSALAFAGEVPVRCRLLAGPTRDFNVMTRRGVYAHSLARCSLDGSIDLAGECFVHVLGGAAHVDGATLAAGDSLRLAAGEVTLRGTADLVVVRLRAG